jgi:hypothetical protein
MSAQSVPRFSTPTEYLRYLRSAYAIRRQAPATPHEELRRLTRESLDDLGLPHPDPQDPYGMVLQQLADQAEAGFRARDGIEVSESCAIGPLDDPSVNARCFRSDEGHYAIVLHHGLMNLLHKHSKLLTAAVDPSSVIYCNRKDPSQLTSRELASWADELGEIYRLTGETNGAMVKLEHEAMITASTMLVMSEAFVLGHEIGHMAAGHLEDDSRLVADEKVPWLQFLPEGSLHEDEFEADRYGFEAMRDHDEGTPKSMLLGALVSTFSVLTLIGAGAASKSHPSAMDRIHHLVELHFSADTAKLVRQWIDDGDHQASVVALETAH